MKVCENCLHLESNGTYCVACIVTKDGPSGFKSRHPATFTLQQIVLGALLLFIASAGIFIAKNLDAPKRDINERFVVITQSGAIISTGNIYLSHIVADKIFTEKLR